MNTQSLIILSGKVIHGKQKGRLICFPTANIEISKEQVLPELGVYSSLVYIDNQVFNGITNIGTRPTADNEEAISIETHIIDFEGNLYDKEISVTLTSYLRGINRFNSMEELGQQLKADCLKAVSINKSIMPSA